MITLTAKITLGNSEEIFIDRRNIISIERNISSRSNFKLPSYGIISNTGNIEFKDKDGKILNYANGNLLTSDLGVEIILNDTLQKSNHNIGYYKTKEWSYDNDNRSVSVSLKDDLEEWQDISIESLPYDHTNPTKYIQDGKMSSIYKWLHGKTPNKYSMLSYDELDNETKEILNNYSISYPFLNQGSLWASWQKLCDVCGLYIYKNGTGQTICYYDFGA